MEYNIFKKNLHLLKSLFEKIEKSHEKSDKVLFQQTIEDCEKYLNDTDNDKVYQDLLSEKFHITMTKILKTFVDKNDLLLMKSIAKFLSTITQYSEAFSEALVSVGAPDLLIFVTIKLGNMNFGEQNSLTCDSILYHILHITYDIIRHIRFHRFFLLHKDIDEFRHTVQPWMSSNVINTRILATFVMTWLMKEDPEDKYMIEKHSNVIKEVCEYIQEVVKLKDKYYRGYSLWELLLGLQGLVSIDSVKVEIIHIGGLISTLIDIISSELSESKEIEVTLTILWSLTFVEQNRDILKDEYHIEDIVQKLLTNDNELIRTKAKGLLWEQTRNLKLSHEKDLEYDVFISYSHAQKEPIAKLADVLRKHFKVWIDTDNIKGSGLSDMADGIERSTIFVMAVSTSYKQSQCCRSEANWAFKLNKPIVPLIMVHKYNPDGWLGMMISSETYIDYSDKSDFSEACDKIMQHISYKCNQARNVIGSIVSEINEPKPDTMKAETKKSAKKSTDLPEDIRDWNGHDVSQWLSAHKLSHLKSKFADFDGGMLLALRNMMEKTYEKYNDHMEKKFKMSLTEILKLDSALSSLKM